MKNLALVVVAITGLSVLCFKTISIAAGTDAGAMVPAPATQGGDLAEAAARVVASGALSGAVPTGDVVDTYDPIAVGEALEGATEMPSLTTIALAAAAFLYLLVPLLGIKLAGTISPRSLKAIKEIGLALAIGLACFGTMSWPFAVTVALAPAVTIVVVVVQLARGTYEAT